MDDVVDAFMQAVANVKVDEKAPELSQIEREGLATS